jgi:hypothetical protein
LTVVPTAKRLVGQWIDKVSEARVNLEKFQTPP